MATSAGARTVHDYSISGVIAASAVGTMIEWYDFYIFGSLAAYLAPKFYPPGNDLFAYIAYLATFSAPSKSSATAVSKKLSTIEKEWHLGCLVNTCKGSTSGNLDDLFQH